MSQVSSLQSLAPSDPHKTEQILAQLDDLPAPACADWPSADPRKLAERISLDPHLLADLRSILALPPVDPRPPLAIVEEWIVHYGLDGVRQLAVILKLSDSIESTGRLDISEFRRHGIAVASAAMRMAEALGVSITPLEAFAAGLVHDIGKAALDAALPKSYARVLRHGESMDADIADIERSVLGVDHTAAGRRIAERWNLSKQLTEVIWLHHHLPESLPAGIAAGRHVQIVQLADTLARERRIGFSGTKRIVRPSRLLAQQLGLTEEKRQAIFDGLLSDVAERAARFAAKPVGAGARTAIDAGVRARRSADRLTDENRRLENKIRFYEAMDRLNQSLSATVNVREVCAAGAEAIQKACNVRAVVFVISECGEWLDLGWAEGQTRSAIYQRTGERSDGAPDGAVAAETAMAGAWLTPPPEVFADVVDRARGALGGGSIRLFPLINLGRWIGGALLAGEPADLAALSTHVEGLSALSNSVGLALARAKEHTAARRLADELSEANRRSSSLEPELVRRQTLETVLAMAAGAAHELNNPLAVISGRAQLLRGRATTDDDRSALQEIARQAQIASDIVTELMDFARPCEPVPESVELPDFFETFRAELISEGLLDDASLMVEVARNVPPIWFDRTQLTGLLRELIANSIEATSSDGRRLTVKAASDLTEEHVVVSVSDNGRGMTADVLGRAMDPFFSHRPAGRGRGLGLARVHRWIVAGKAAIRIDSQPGQGTKVTLRLPIPPAAK